MSKTKMKCQWCSVNDAANYYDHRHGLCESCARKCQKVCEGTWDKVEVLRRKAKVLNA